MAYSYHLGRGEPEQAGVELDYALEHAEALAPGLRPIVWLEAAYFLARYRQDVAGACAHLERTRGAALIETYSRHRAEAAVHYAEGDFAATRASAEMGLAALGKARIGAAGNDEAHMLAELQSLAASPGSAR
jgi:hypothetical protein